MHRIGPPHPPSPPPPLVYAFSRKHQLSFPPYRYELYCVAKGASTRYCVTHCELPTEVSRGWNALRACCKVSCRITRATYSFR